MTVKLRSSSLVAQQIQNNCSRNQANENNNKLHQFGHSVIGKRLVHCYLNTRMMLLHRPALVGRVSSDSSFSSLRRWKGEGGGEVCSEASFISPHCIPNTHLKSSPCVFGTCYTQQRRATLPYTSAAPICGGAGALVAPADKGELGSCSGFYISI